MNIPVNLYRLLAYALLYFFIYISISLAIGDFFVPIKQLFTGQSVDFATYWQQVNIAREVLLGVIFSIALTVHKYRKEKKVAEEGQQA